MALIVDLDLKSLSLKVFFQSNCYHQCCSNRELNGISRSCSGQTAMGVSIFQEVEIAIVENQSCY